jgi:4-diphosphocytidyl-2-C-methyl-D-erythritol kinase
MTRGRAGTSVSRLAPAKINLYLHVLGRRGDGYHLLDSLVVFPRQGDQIEVSPADDLRLTVSGPFAADVPAGDDNLVLRAARALAAATGRVPAVAIHLEKRLPVASGIGGGSADAAAVLRGLARLWELPIKADILARIALSLGADVPMCLNSRSAFIGGVGDEVATAPELPDFAVVLVNPRIPLPTPAVFRTRTGPFSAAGRFSNAPTDAMEMATLLARRRNDLTSAAIGLVPAVADVLSALERAPGVMLSRMSGSGATCFGLCADQAGAESTAAALAAEHPGWWVTAASVAASSAVPAE